MMRRVRVMMMALLLVVALASSVTAQENRLKVVASFSIIADVVQNVGGDAIELSTLIPLGADPHTYEPNPRDLIQLVEAGVVFVAGANFEEGLMEVIENAAEEMNIVELSLCVEILPYGVGGHSHDDHDDEHEHDHDDEHEHDHDDEHEHDHDDEHMHDDDDEHMHDDDEMMSVIAALCARHIAEFETLEADHHMHDDDDHMHDDDDDHMHDDDHEHDHDDEHEHDHDHDHSHSSDALGRLYQIECEGHGHSHDDDDHDHDHSHAEGECDPHVWSDPHNVMYWVMMIRDTLSELDPANADLYAANAAAYLAELDELTHDFVSAAVSSVPAENRVLVTNHETLGYFAHRYGFEVVATVLPGSSTIAEPSAAQVAALIDLIREEGVTAIFAENTAGATLAEQIADETGAQFFELFTDSLGSADSPASTYLDYIRYNVSTIVNALGGDA